MEIEAICWPDYERPAMQTITVVGKAEPCFEIARADNLVAAFDEHGAFTYGLAAGENGHSNHWTILVPRL